MLDALVLLLCCRHWDDVALSCSVLEAKLGIIEDYTLISGVMTSAEL